MTTGAMQFSQFVSSKDDGFLIGCGKGHLLCKGPRPLELKTLWLVLFKSTWCTDSTCYIYFASTWCWIRLAVFWSTVWFRAATTPMFGVHPSPSRVKFRVRKPPHVTALLVGSYEGFVHPTTVLMVSNPAHRWRILSVSFIHQWRNFQNYLGSCRMNCCKSTFENPNKKFTLGWMNQQKLWFHLERILRIHEMRVQSLRNKAWIHNR